MTFSGFSYQVFRRLAKYYASKFKVFLKLNLKPIILHCKNLEKCKGLAI